jgi:nucleotide-binding universal stress UspA family protein
MRRIRRILHGSDFSWASRAAFARSVDLARATGAELTLVHVSSRAIPYVREAALRDQLRAAMRAEARKQLEALVAKARRARVHANALLLDGWPAEGILRAARSRRPDRVVIGTHGRTRLARAFRGSVAARVIATARCPVLTVRGSRRGSCAGGLVCGDVSHPRRGRASCAEPGSARAP